MRPKPADYLSRIRPRSRFFLAPMAEFTNPAMRMVSIEYGAGCVYTEMADAGKLIEGDAFTRKLVAFGSEEHPIVGQLIAADAETGAEGARILEGAGFNAVDLNGACCIRRIIARGMGADLMRDLNRLGKIVETMRSAVRIPVTVKMRSGFDAGSMNAVEVGRVCESSGAAAIGIHGRTAQQGYRGPADWEIIARLKESVSVPVFGSGDVRTAQDAVRMMKETGCDAVMVARGALGNPWIFRDAKHLAAGGERGQLPRPPAGEVLKVMRRHYRLLVGHAGRRKANLLFRRVGGYYCAHLPDGREVKKRIQQMEEDDRLETVL